MKRIGFTMLALAACLAGANCGGGGDSTTGVTTPPPGDPHEVVVSNDKFTPASMTVPTGTTVTWTWDACSGDLYGDQTCTDHQVGFDDGPTSALQSTGTYSRAFDKAGTYPYHCLVHGVAMSGSIVVQ